jgi:Holliday junction resolvasome RuvABC ATP-dependent DNA helicase subunit
MTYLDNIIGQQAVKTRLAIYRESYKKDSVLPFLLVVGCRGGGKTKLIREFRKSLVREDGSRPPILEINCATINSASAFFDQVYPKWVDNDAVLFADEVHTLPAKLQEIFLTVLEKDRNPVRRVTFADVDYTFDFTRISFIGATTDHQKLSGPLDDRLTKINLAPYNKEELFEILKSNLSEVELHNEVTPLIKDIFRGHPRHCVEIAEDLNKYGAAKSISKIYQDNWAEFCQIMGIHAHGFNEAEMQIIRVLGQRGEASLEALAASTGYSKSVIRTKYEHALLSRGILEVGQRRSLTRIGKEFYRKLEKEG